MDSNQKDNYRKRIRKIINSNLYGRMGIKGDSYKHIGVPTDKRTEKEIKRDIIMRILKDDPELLQEAIYKLRGHKIKNILNND